MIIYLVLVFICLALSAYSYQKTCVRVPNGYTREEQTIVVKERINGLFWLSCLIFILIIGLRADNIGIDTLNYKTTYKIVSNYSFSSILDYTIYESIGFRFIMVLFGKLNVSWQLFCLFVASIYVIPFGRLVFKECDNPFLGLLLFVLSGLFTFPMSTVRQSIAIGVSVEAFNQDRKGRNILCIILIILASSFHFSAILCLAYFLLKRIPFDIKNWGIWILAGAMIVLFGTNVLRVYLFQAISLVGQSYETTNTGGVITELFYVFIMLSSVFLVRNRDVFFKKYSDYVKALYLTVIILPIVRVHPALFRTYMYFSIYEIILVPSIIRYSRESRVKFLLIFVFFVAYIYLFFTQSLSVNRMVTPYLFFWQ